VQVSDPAHPSTEGISEPFEFSTDATWLSLNGLIWQGTREPTPFRVADWPEGTNLAAYWTREAKAPVNSLSEVDKLISGESGSIKIRPMQDPEVTDLNGGAGGSWEDFEETFENLFEESLAGGFATVSTGTIQVNLAGKYTFALGVQGGGRLRVDLNKNGFGPEDDVIELDSLDSFGNAFGGAKFEGTGEYEFQWVSFNDRGNFGAELSVTFEPDPDGIASEPVDYVSFERLGDHGDNPNIELGGNIDLTVYVPDLELVEEKYPVLLTFEQGSNLVGGVLRGFEGQGFFAGAALNKFGEGKARSLELNPINVRCDGDLKMKVALAGIRISFDPSDFLEIKADKDGDGPADFELVAAVRGFDGGPVVHYPDPSAVGDLKNHPEFNLGAEFTDVVFDLPDDATDLVLRFEAFSTWYDEILAFDNVRVYRGEDGEGPAPEVADISVGDNGDGTITVTFDGALQSAPTVNGPWSDVDGAASPLTVTPGDEAGQQFFRSKE